MIKSILKDRVVLALLVAFVLLAIFDRSQAIVSLRFTVTAFFQLLPFLLIAISLAAFIKASGADQLVAKAFTGNPIGSIFLASMAGALSPFCSCGVVPVIAGLLRARVPLAPVMAFWIASPIMDPEMFVLTTAGISLEFAAVKTLATFSMGALAGFAVYLMPGINSFTTPLAAESYSGCNTDLDTNAEIDWKFWPNQQKRQAFIDELIVVGLFLSKWMLLAFLLESLMLTYLPPDWIASTLGSGRWYEIPLAALVGIPAYLNGYAAIPLISGLLDLGINPGAALAFMTAGAVSSIPAAMAVFVLVKRSVFIAYLTLGLCGSILTGTLYSIVLAS